MEPCEDNDARADDHCTPEERPPDGNDKSDNDRNAEQEDGDDKSVSPEERPLDGDDKSVSADGEGVEPEDTTVELPDPKDIAIFAQFMQKKMEQARKPCSYDEFRDMQHDVLARMIVFNRRLPGEVQALK